MGQFLNDRQLSVIFGTLSLLCEPIAFSIEAVLMHAGRKKPKRSLEVNAVAIARVAFGELYIDGV